MTMDKAHTKMLKNGYFRFLFLPVLDLDNLNPVRGFMRQIETRSFPLLPSNLNTQQQSVKGVPDAVVVH